MTFPTIPCPPGASPCRELFCSGEAQPGFTRCKRHARVLVEALAMPRQVKGRIRVYRVYRVMVEGREVLAWTTLNRARIHARQYGVPYVIVEVQHV